MTQLLRVWAIARSLSKQQHARLFTTNSTTSTSLTNRRTPTHHHVKMANGSLVNLDEPRWDQSSFAGRAKHFLVTTNPLNVLASDDELDAAKRMVLEYRAGLHPDMDEDEIWRAKQLVDSAFHPDTGEKNFILGRMSFQVPGNMLITGCMMTFYRSTPAVIFWQVRPFPCSLVSLCAWLAV